MSTQIPDNNIDDKVDEIIFNCLNVNELKSFFLFAGAGSGKTKTLVNVLEKINQEYGKQLRLRRKKVAIITYTNAAADEIIHRLKYSSIFHVSTIHSFAWDLIRMFTHDIRFWLKENIQSEIAKLEELQNKSKNLQNKTSREREKKIQIKRKRLQNLENIIQFTYNPNGNNLSKESLNHSEVIKITAFFIKNKKVMQDLFVCKYPILLIDESQDTKKELIDAFFNLQQNNKKSFSLGLIGDTMQRIYTDGKENLGKNLPIDIVCPVKKMNHRSNKRIIQLINKIRRDVDQQEQKPRIEKKAGTVRLFICSRNLIKREAELKVYLKMAEITNDQKWNPNLDGFDVKNLILEHHMAARRMGFGDFFKALYKINKYKTSLLDGSLTGVTFFTNIILPLVNAHKKNDEFEISRIVKKNCNYLKKEELEVSKDPIKNIKKAKEGVNSLLSLFEKSKEPTLLEIIRNVYKSKLFPIPESIVYLVSDDFKNKKIINEETEKPNEVTEAWEMALANPLSQLIRYDKYISGNSSFGTHQGVKGLEFTRVLIIIDDEESGGFLFSYDKLFGTKELSKNDKRNIEQGNETGIDRTKRLFYVACSRAKESLAIAAYTDNVVLLKEMMLKYGWFKECEIEILK